MIEKLNENEYWFKWLFGDNNRGLNESSASDAIKDISAKLNEVIDVLNSRQTVTISDTDILKSAATFENTLTEVTTKNSVEREFVQPTPKEGDLCYFWDIPEGGVVLSKLKDFLNSGNPEFNYVAFDGTLWNYCQLAEINGLPNYPEHIKKLMK